MRDFDHDRLMMQKAEIGTRIFRRASQAYAVGFPGDLIFYKKAAIHYLTLKAKRLGML